MRMKFSEQLYKTYSQISLKIRALWREREHLKVHTARVYPQHDSEGVGIEHICMQRFDKLSLFQIFM